MTAGSVFGKLHGRIAHWWGRSTALDVYCTYFDSAYLARGIVMLRSLRHYDPSARIVALTLDALCASALRGEFGSDTQIQVIETKTLHAAFPELRLIREQRSTWAYYATQKPALVVFAMGSHPPPAGVTYIDADTWFFGDPSATRDEIGIASVGIWPHRFPVSLQGLAVYGVYNAGCVYWRNDETGRRCLSDWRDECLRWCDATVESDGRFMNQGYLNSWPARFSGVHVVQHPGSNLAPWNVDGHVLSVDGGQVKVDGASLVFYHFSGLSRDAEGRWFNHYPIGRQADLICESIYRPYILAVEAEGRKLQRSHGIDGTGSVRAMADWPTAFQFERWESAAPRRP